MSVPSGIQIQAARATSPLYVLFSRIPTPSRAEGATAFRASHGASVLARRMNRTVKAGSERDAIVFSAEEPLALIAGPCVIENEHHVLWIAQKIREIAGKFVFKASFDKANRSNINSYRGPGLKEGLRILGEVRKLGIPVLTDVHEAFQAEIAAEFVDILQIPAFLCRQTDLLIAA